MTEQTNLDQRPRLPYSIGTGIPKQGQAEIEGYLQSLRLQGFCLIERVITCSEDASCCWKTGNGSTANASSWSGRGIPRLRSTTAPSD